MRIRRRTVVAVVLAAGVGCCDVGSAQRAGTVEAPTLPRFEVESVKPSPEGARGFGGGGPVGGQWRSTNATLLDLIYTAYDLRPGFIVGGPPWLSRDRFVIAAKAPGQPPLSQMRLMLRSLLAERFTLRVHNEMRPTDVYILTKARSDGQLGPRLRSSKADCAALRAARGSNAPIATDAPPNARAACESNSGMDSSGNVRLSETWKLEQLVKALQTWMDRAILDRTGLEGYYDLDLVFDFASRRAPDPSHAEPGAGASIFTALREQLGLKLESKREMVDVLVIDGATRPDPD